MKITSLIIILISSILFFVSCQKEVVKIDLPEVSVVNISKESNWDYWVVGKQDYYYLKTENSLPKAVLFHSSEANKDYSIFFTPDGMVDKVAVDNYIFIFRNFNGTKADIGVIDPAGNIQLLRQVETDYYYWSIKAQKIPKSTKEWSDVIRWTGRIVGGVPCVLSAYAAVQTLGTAIPLAMWSCGNYFLKLSGDIAENDLNIHNGFTEFVDTYKMTTLIYNCGGGGTLTDCAFSASSKGFSEWAAYQEQIEESRNSDVQTTQDALNYGYGDVQLTLSWDNEADLDLHVYDPYNEEIWWDHKYSYSGGILDVDNTTGYGPENIYWPQSAAPNGRYEVYVHSYNWVNETWRPYYSNFTVLINAFGKTRKYTGTIGLDETIHIVDFNQNGYYAIIVDKQFNISKSVKIKVDSKPLKINLGNSK